MQSCDERCKWAVALFCDAAVPVLDVQVYATHTVEVTLQCDCGCQFSGLVDLRYLSWLVTPACCSGHPAPPIKTAPGAIFREVRG